MVEGSNGTRQPPNGRVILWTWLEKASGQYSSLGAKFFKTCQKSFLFFISWTRNSFSWTDITIQSTHVSTSLGLKEVDINNSGWLVLGSKNLIPLA
jgi:hypothetical protein